MTFSYSWFTSSNLCHYTCTCTCTCTYMYIPMKYGTINGETTFIILTAVGGLGKPSMAVFTAVISLHLPRPQAFIPATRNLYGCPGFKTSYNIIDRLTTWCCTLQYAKNVWQLSKCQQPYQIILLHVTIWRYWINQGVDKHLIGSSQSQQGSITT